MRNYAIGFGLFVLGGCQTATSYFDETPTGFLGASVGTERNSNISRKSDAQYYLAKPQLTLSLTGSTDDSLLGNLEAKVEHVADKDAPFIFTRGRNLFDNEYTIQIDERGLLGQVVAGGEGAVGSFTQALAQTSASFIVNDRIAKAIEAGDAVDEDAIPSISIESNESGKSGDEKTGLQAEENHSADSNNGTHSIPVRSGFSITPGSPNQYSKVCDLDLNPDDTVICMISTTREYFYWGKRDNPTALSGPQCPMEYIDGIDRLKEPADSSSSQDPTLFALSRTLKSSNQLAAELRQTRDALIATNRLSGEALVKTNADIASHVSAARVAETTIRAPASYRLAQMPNALCKVRISARIRITEFFEGGDENKARPFPLNEDFGKQHRPKLPFQNDLVYYRPLLPAQFIVEQCIHEPGQPDCNAWSEVHSFSASIADTSQLRSVPFLSASAGSNALAVRFVDGTPVYAASVENPASSELLSAPLQIVEAVLSVPRALLVGAADQVDGN